MTRGFTEVFRCILSMRCRKFAVLRSGVAKPGEGHSR